MLKKIFVLMFCIVGLANCQISANASQTPQTDAHLMMVQHLQDSTVALVMPNCVGLTPSNECIIVHRVYCSGVWISKNRFLTAHHCVQAFITSQSTDEELENNEDEKLLHKKILFLSRDQVPHDDASGVLLRPGANEGTVINYDSKNDLALIEVPKRFESNTYVELSDEKLLLGQEIHVIGHTVGIPYTYAHGHISGIRIDDIGMGPISVLQISAPTYFGNSGGGVFTNDGKLVGICSYLYKKAPMHLNFFIHRDTVIDFLNNKTPVNVVAE